MAGDGIDDDIDDDDHRAVVTTDDRRPEQSFCDAIIALSVTPTHRMTSLEEQAPEEVRPPMTPYDTL